MTVDLNMAMGNVKMGDVTVPMGTVVKVAVILCVAMPVQDMVSQNRENEKMKRRGEGVIRFDNYR